MDRIDEIIGMMEKITCPKSYKKCPGRVAGNDCDNECLFVEAVDMLKDYKKLKPEDGEANC